MDKLHFLTDKVQINFISWSLQTPCSFHGMIEYISILNYYRNLINCGHAFFGFKCILLWLLFLLLFLLTMWWWWWCLGKCWVFSFLFWFFKSLILAVCVFSQTWSCYVVALAIFIPTTLTGLASCIQQSPWFSLSSSGIICVSYHIWPSSLAIHNTKKF